MNTGFLWVIVLLLNFCWINTLAHNRPSEYALVQDEDGIDDIVNKNANRQVNSPQSIPNANNPDKISQPADSKSESDQTTDEVTTFGKSPHRGSHIISGINDIYFVAIVAGCSALGLIGIVLAIVCWCRFQRRVKAAGDIDYPAYGVTGPTKERSPTQTGDRKLAQSAQMYHYQHQKQQMIALEKATGDVKHDASEEESEDDHEESDYTVYECPGLAPTGEMEVKNPLFEDNYPAPPSSGNDTPMTQSSNIR